MGAAYGKELVEAYGKELVEALEDIGADLKNVGEDTLQALWANGYINSSTLRSATREGLTASTLPPAQVDYLLG